METRRVEAERLKEFAKRVFGTLQGAVTAGMIHLGDRLGLYRALAEGAGDERASSPSAPGSTSAGCASGCASRARRVCSASTPPSASPSRPRAWRCSPTSATRPSAAACSRQLPQTMAVLERLPEAFASGLGLPYDAFGPEGARGVERGFAPWYRTFLVPARDREPRRREARSSSGARRWRTSAAAAASRCSSWRAPSRARSSTATSSRATPSSAPRRIAPRPGSRTCASTTRAARRSPPTAASTWC